MNWKSFALGFVAGVALLSAISHLRARPQDLIAPWPEENQKAMKMIAPWVTEARVGRLGPFIAMTPKSFEASPEAILQPANGKNPLIFLSGEEITINDSKKRAINIRYDASTGEFLSYSFFPDFVAGPMFTDKQMTGVLEKWQTPAKKR